MEGPENKSNQERQVFIKGIKSLFKSILGDHNKDIIFLHLNQLDMSIFVASMRELTTSSGFGEEVTKFLSLRLLNESSSSRAEILLNALKKCGLEEGFLEVLRESINE